MTRDISSLISAVNRVGIQNISLLSRMTGVPTETIRYTMKKRLPALGLQVRTPVNHAALGLERYFVSMRLTESAEAQVAGLMKGLSSTAFLTYWCNAPLDRRYLSFFSVPVALVDEFRGFLERLAKERLLIDYACERLEWSRNPEIKGEHYDFATGEWSIDWKEIGKHNESPPEPVKVEEPSPNPDIDAIDTLVIKELEVDSWRNIAEIARKLKLNERTVRWHYKKHIADIMHSNYVNWSSVTPKESTKAVGLIQEFNGISTETLVKLRRLFNNFPFSWFEGGRKDGYYQVHAGLPANYFMESLRYLNTNVKGLVDDWKVWTVDLSSIRWFTIPYENFDEEKGWFFSEEAALQAVLPRKVKLRKTEP